MSRATDPFQVEKWHRMANPAASVKASRQSLGPILVSCYNTVAPIYPGSAEHRQIANKLEQAPGPESKMIEKTVKQVVGHTMCVRSTKKSSTLL